MTHARVVIDGIEYFVQGGHCTGWVHVQSTPSQEWDVQTPPGDACPLVQIWHDDGYQIDGEVEYISPGNIKIKFNSGETGTAIIINLIGV